MQQGFHNGYPDMVRLCRDDGVGEEKKKWHSLPHHFTLLSSVWNVRAHTQNTTHSVTSGKMWFILLTNENLKDEDLKNGS